MCRNVEKSTQMHYNAMKYLCVYKKCAKIKKNQREEDAAMANAVNINFRMDPDLKKDMEKLCDELGMSMTTAFTIFAKKMTREHRIPFDVSADPFYSENNMRYLNGIVQDIKTGKAHFAEHELLEDD